MCFKNNLYSVPIEFINKTVSVQAIDDYLYIYYSTLLIAVHRLSKQKINYHSEHYEQALKTRFKYKEDDEIKEIAKK